MTRHPLDEMVHAQKEGLPLGIASVCSAHPIVLSAAADQAVTDGNVLLVEATSNQVDQYGGYTGMRPTDFRDLVHRVAAESGLPLERVVLGGDHLGPHAWRSMPVEQAMIRAEELVRAYTAAGFTKIHLDCSYRCADDELELTDDVVATRAARLLKVANDTASAPAQLRYVIGTEVPLPGGADHAIDNLRATTPGAARATLAAHRTAFASVGLEAVWPQVLGLVVQPGVEFDNLQVIDYDRSKTSELRHVLDDEPHMVFEAHSTDYQTVEHLAELIEDHWAVLKVGPGLTFALREALFALARIEDDVLPAARRSQLRRVVEARMVAEPGQWQGYYNGDAHAQWVSRTYSYSDRLRYYWPAADVQAAQDRLLDNLTAHPLPMPLLSAHLPDQYARVRRDELVANPLEIVKDRVRDVIRDYGAACRTREVLL